MKIPTKETREGQDCRHLKMIKMGGGDAMGTNEWRGPSQRQSFEKTEELRSRS